MRTNTTHDDHGFIIGSLLVLIIIVSVLLVTITSSTVSTWQSSVSQNARTNAQLAGDAGLDIGIHEINQDASWPGTGYTWNGTAWVVGPSSEVELLNTGDIRTTYEVIVTDVSPTRKTIRSLGKTYQPASATTAKSTRIFELEAEEVTSGTGPGSVVSGVGGLILNNNAKITGGDVIVNGSVTVNNNAQIGLSTTPNANAVNLRVAHQSCPSPADATYPFVCTANEPITNDGLIYADVQAQNQTSSSGMSNPGLVGSSFAPVVVPGYDRPAQKAAVVNTYSPTDNAVRCISKSATWTANIRITGDFNLPNNCDVTVEGDVWIEGDLTFGNNAQILIADSLGATRPIIMLDGSSGLDTGNNTRFVSNASGTGAEVITVWWNTDTSTNGNFDCGGIADPYDCTTVTGLALSTSQGQTTIDLSNNTDATDTVFRTLWSKAEISNNGALGAVSGQTIQLQNNAVINFTASIPGSDNLISTWVKRGYLRVFQ